MVTPSEGAYGVATLDRVVAVPIAVPRSMLLAYAILLGASVGSFVNVVVDRLPAERSLVTPRSAGEVCNRPLSLWEMVPVLSYLWLKGQVP